MSFCPFCGVRADVDLRQIHFRDLGTDASLPCPHCDSALGIIEFETDPKVRIERCPECLGMFFNPGELEFLLESETNPLVWLDPKQLDQIATDYGFHHEVIYRKCPCCAERMSHLNFGGNSGVILDFCGTHGVWLESGELRRLLEWWRAGGKLFHQQHEEERARRLAGASGGGSGGKPLTSLPGSGTDAFDFDGFSDHDGNPITVGRVLGGIFDLFFD